MSNYSRKLRYFFSLPALVACLAAGLATAQSVTDEDVALAVNNELAYSDVAGFHQIGISADDGIVSLTGTVPSITAFRQIENITSTVRGVRGIVNRLERPRN